MRLYLPHTLFFALVILGGATSLAPSVYAQGSDLSIEDEADPSRIFEQAQNAHAKGDLARAVELYTQALRVRPQFPEARLQRAVAYLVLNDLPAAEADARQVMTWRSTWAAAPALLADVLTRQNRSAEADTLISRAIQLEPNDAQTLLLLARLRLASPTATGITRAAAAKWLARATTLEPENADLWAERGLVESKFGDASAAQTSLDTALRLNPTQLSALLERANLEAERKEFIAALRDVQTARRVVSETPNLPQSADLAARLTLQQADLQIRVGDRAAASQTLATLTNPPAALQEDLKLLQARLAPSPPTENPNTSDAVAALSGSDAAKEQAALEGIIQREPRNALALARLGALLRRTNPEQSMLYFRRAVEVEPTNADYATGFAAALVQARRYPEAVTVLHRIITIAPDNYAAHANLATALEEQKLYADALTEYQWLNRAKPDLTIVYYFIGRTHDLLGQFPEALTAYQTFVAKADDKTNQLEIERVNLRLPSLQRQIKQGQGVKRK